MDLFISTILPVILLTLSVFWFGYNIGNTRSVTQPEKHECPLCNGVGWIQPGMLERFRAQIKDE